MDYSKLVDESIEEVNANWKNNLARGRKGVLEQSIENYTLFLSNDPKYKGKLKYNEYLRQKEYDGEEFNDFTLNKLYADVEKMFYSCNRGNVDTALNNIFDDNRYNPVVDYIKSLKWDGVKRIETLFIDLLEADDTPLVREMTRKWMIAAVKRTLYPGCKFDNMIMLCGAQGIGKTTICEKLSNGFYSTISIDEIGNKDLIDKLNKTWIAIIDEMDGFSKGEMTKTKTFLSLNEDRVRLPYERMSSTFKRHCVFIGGTNDSAMLRDQTGNRRFWPITCNKTTKDSKVIDTMTPEFVNQLWAEALYYLNDNTNQYLDISYDSLKDFEEEQKKYMVSNEDGFIDAMLYELDKEFTVDCDGEITDISQMNGYRSGIKGKINKIHLVVFKQYMKDIYKETRSTKYITGALKTSGEFEVKDARFKSLGGKTQKAIVRVKPTIATNKVVKKITNPLDEFTKFL